MNKKFSLGKSVTLHLFILNLYIDEFVVILKKVFLSVIDERVLIFFF